MNFMQRSFRELKQYPSAIAGLALIGLIIFMAIYAMFYMPYDEAIDLWRGSDNVWIETPRNVPPKWINLFRKNKLPETISLKSSEMPETKWIEGEDGFYEARIEHVFDFQADEFPSEVNLFFQARYADVSPYVEVSWHTPDGRVIPLRELSVRRNETYRISQDDRLRRRV